MFRLLLFLFCFSTTVCAQTRAYSVKKQLKDFEILKESLLHVTGHPYLYTDSLTFVHLFDSIQLELQTPKTALELFQSFSFLTAKLQCGHTNIFPNNRLLRDYLFYSLTLPVLITVADGRLYATDNYGKAPKLHHGDEIISINNRSAAQVLNSMHQHFSSDAKNVTMKNKYFGYFFNLYYFITFGEEDSFHISFVTETQDTLSLVAPAELANIKDFKKSYLDAPFTKHHPNKNNYGRLKTDKTVGYHLLELPSFEKSLGTKYSRFIDAKMRSINKSDLGFLVVDLRGNLGGKPQAYLMGYFTNQDDHILEYSVNSGSKPRYHRHFRKVSRYYIQYRFTQWRYNKMKKSGLVYKQKAGIVLRPEDEMCSKKVIVLIDGFTFSAGANLAANLKDKADAIIIGEESGGSYKQGNTGQLRLKLPKTNFRLTINPIYYNNNVKLNQGDAGLIPDIMVLNEFSTKRKDDPYLKAIEDVILSTKSEKLE